MPIAFIPARGGSKRIPLKNIKEFAGKPMLAHSVDMCLKSGLFSRVVVSSESQEILSTAEKYGAETHVRQNPNSYSDSSTLVDAVSEFLSGQPGLDLDQAICCVLPCTPLLNFEILREAHDLFLENRDTYVFPVLPTDQSIGRALIVNGDNFSEIVNLDLASTQTNKAEETYFDSGQFYWGLARLWIKKTPILSSKCKVIKLPKYSVIDIDTIEDWKIAELIYSNRNQF